MRRINCFCVAFLSDPWGVATVEKKGEEEEGEGRKVAFLSDPWGVATHLQ